MNSQPKTGWPWRSIIIGTIGMLIAIYGNLTTNIEAQKLAYLIGAIILLSTSVLERQVFFMALQTVILIGAAIAFFQVTLLFKAVLFSIVAVIAVIFLLQQKFLKDILTFLGTVGLLLLAAGYATSQPLLYCFGALLLTIYSAISFKRGVKIALVWAILNGVFFLTAGITVYRYLM